MSSRWFFYAISLSLTFATITAISTGDRDMLFCGFIMYFACFAVGGMVTAFEENA